jgi:hypothetical protein
MPVIRERDVERYLVKRVRALGGAVRKVRWIGRRNAPDRLVLAPDLSPFLLELKAPGKKPTPAQAREIALLNQLGQSAEWADCAELIECHLNNYKKERAR